MTAFSSTLKAVACSLFVGSAAWVATAQTPVIAAPSNMDCMTCHATNVSASAYGASVHHALTCTACHIKDETKPVAQVATGRTNCVVSFKAVDCSACHGAIVKDHATSVHNSPRLPIACAKCHADIHAITSIKNDKVTAARLCSQCHQNETNYFNSIHFKALAEGKNDSATCVDCHGLHAISKIDNVAEGRLFHTKACLKCHADTEKMARNSVTTVAPQTFFESYHGKNVRLGYPERVAGCADCHSSHGILPAKDTNSTVNVAHLTRTCGQCHTGASVGFTKFIPHAEPANHSKFPILFWVTASMTALLVGTFLFFWVHSFLWAIRAFIEKKQNRDAAFFAKSAHAAGGPVAIKQKVYRRFRLGHIILHLFVVTSFLGLALTGLPLKFNATPWGKAMMDFMGGPDKAGLIHRVCAVVTFGYFMVALAMSARFLFTNKRQNETFFQRLFGPDSLFPNLKDLSDIMAMFRWFFFRGPKPSFDRWTYWEKFDFMAVFWGVTIIGSSGLLLWLPEFFGQFLPGWVFNVATIIHSDEALLATGFIFTIHFFNTHFRPEKFPMDFVIFNGQVTEEEMIHERSEQWKRYQELGIANEFEVKEPSPLAWDMALRLFGLLAVLIGVILALLMFYTFIIHRGG
jgi:cytochrome b subunit of formate dehydrogenase